MLRRKVHSVSSVWFLATAAIVVAAIVAGAVGRLQLKGLLADIDRDEQYTAELRTAVENRLNAMLNQEVGLRGYLATGNREFLEPYYAGRVSDEDAQTLIEADGADREEIAAALADEEHAAQRW